MPATSTHPTTTVPDDTSSASKRYSMYELLDPPDIPCAFRRPQTPSMTLSSTPTTHRTRTSTVRNGTHGKDNLAKPSETSRPRHHPDDLPCDVTLLAHPHTPPLSTYDVQEPSCGLQELRKMNGTRTEIPENAEDAEKQEASWRPPVPARVKIYDETTYKSP